MPTPRTLLILATLLALFPRPALAGELASVAAPKAIVGGERTSEFDAVVAVVANGVTCSGTVVAPRLVLTAAHCVHGGGDVTVHAGGTISDGRRWSGKRSAAHPNYCADCSIDRWDFGYVEVDRDFDMEPATVLATQAEYDAALVEGEPLTVVGYGSNDADGHAGMGTKRVAEVFLNSATASGLEFRARADGADTCDGDSGGPAFVEMADGSLRMAGVTSRGTMPCGKGGYYGMPYSALCWIELETGVDLRRDGCGTCDCIAVPAVGEDSGCRVAAEDAPPALTFLWLLGLLGLRRRPRIAP